MAARSNVVQPRPEKIIRPIMDCVRWLTNILHRGGAEEIRVTRGSPDGKIRGWVEKIVDGTPKRLRFRSVSSSRLAGPVMAKFKIMAKLDFAEKTLPQQGCFKIDLLGIDAVLFEVSTSVSEGIETLTLRKV